MLDRYSLNNLLEVSGHPVFGPSLHTLVICVDHLTEDPPRYHPGTWDNPGTIWERGLGDIEAIVNQAAYTRYFDDQTRLGESGLGTAYLTRALTNLSNCKTMFISDTNRPWGAVSQKRQTGVFPTSSIVNLDSIDYVKRTVQVVLAAIIASQISLDHLEISPGLNRKAMGPEMLPARPDLCIDQSLSQITRLAALSLMVNADARWSSNEWATDLLKFIGHFPTLEEFSLHFFKYDEKGRLSALCTRLRLQSLRVLTVVSADCTEDDLATLFINHKDTLRKIFLDSVDIREGKGSRMSLECMIREQLSVETLSWSNYD
ncbi:hypothetical protein ACMFMF_004061 [Clarireedia jacksonii]